MWPGPSFITWTSYSQAMRVSSPCVLQLGELRLVVRVGDRPRPQAVAEREGHVVGAHDLADLAEVRVEEVLLVVRQAPLRHDRAAARHDAGHAPRRQRDVAQQHAGVDGEVVHPLLGLLDERVAVDLPGQVLRAGRPPSRAPGRSARCRSAPAELRRIHSRVSWMFLPVERSITVSAPQSVAQRSFSTSSSIDEDDRRVADVGVDLHEEVAADDHRLELGMVDVGRDDRAAARDFATARTRRPCPRGAR